MKTLRLPNAMKISAVLLAILAGLFAIGREALSTAHPDAPVSLSSAELRYSLAQEQESEEMPTKSNFWIGVKTDESDAILRSQLSIDGGLVIMGLWEDSPAHKAGLLLYDVILTINEDPILTIEELRNGIQSAQGTAIDVGVVRAGNRLSLSVHPELRPLCDDPLVIALDSNEELNQEQMEEFKAYIEKSTGKPLPDVMILRPGLALAKTNTDEAPLQDQSTKPNVLNGKMPGIDAKKIRERAWHFGTTELDKGEPMSGCCMKLMQLMAEEIKEEIATIERINDHLRAMDEADSNPNPHAEANEARVRLEERLKIHMLRRDLIDEARTRLKARIAEDSKEEEKKDPGQSNRDDWRELNWS